jgi:ankyrin repeat protein
MLSFGEKKIQELNEESGETTWHIIAKNGDIEIIQKKYFDLDEREINLKNKEGLTPFAIAIEKNNLEMVKELMRCGAKNSKEDILNLIRTAIEKNNLEIAKELVKYGAENSKEDILNLIGIAIRNENSETCIFLISFFNASSDLNLENKEDEVKLGADAPSCKPSGVKKILVDTLVNYKEDSSKNGSGSRS